jgi:hypothetical protein
MHTPRRIIYKGVTFESLRVALFNMYFYYDEMPEDDIHEAMKYIVPMQHNFDNPLQGDTAKDTFIEYWIARDDRIAQDFSQATVDGGENAAYKLATVDIRFVGIEAELWAKAFHHINQREHVAEIFWEICQGKILEFVGDIVPVNIDYYGVGNSSIAFDLSVKIEYKESIDLKWQPLEYVSLAPGDTISGGTAEQ